MSSGSCIGASGGGSLTELMALGAADKYLTQFATITYWRFRYNKYTNFVMEAIEQPFNSSVQFGGDTQVTMNRNGDLVYFQYVTIDLPGIRMGEVGVGSTGFPVADDVCDPCGDGEETICHCDDIDGEEEEEEEEDPVDCTGLTGP